MVVRKALWYWQFAAVVVLPIWLLVGWTVWGAPASAGDVNLTPFLLVLMTVVAQSALAVVLNLRGTVRRTRTVTWPDAAVLVASSLAVVAAGFWGPLTGTFAAFAALAYGAGYWVGIAEFVVETRKRVRATLDRLGLRPGGATAVRTPIDAGEFTVKPRP